jgi:hypothetical protein
MLAKFFFAALVPLVLSSQIEVNTEAGMDTAKVKELKTNTSRLRVTAQLDRQVYFPGEDAALLIVVTNATQQSLEVFDPLQIRNGRVSLLRRYPTKANAFGAQWLPESPTGDYFLSGGTVWMRPGETIERAFVFSRPGTRVGGTGQGKNVKTICSECQIPELPGEYRFTYGVGGKADFTVVEPKLELWEIVPLERRSEYPSVGSA